MLYAVKKGFIVFKLRQDHSQQMFKYMHWLFWSFSLFLSVFVVFMNLYVITSTHVIECKKIEINGLNQLAVN